MEFDDEEKGKNMMAFSVVPTLDVTPEDVARRDVERLAELVGPTVHPLFGQ